MKKLEKISKLVDYYINFLTEENIEKILKEVSCYNINYKNGVDLLNVTCIPFNDKLGRHSVGIGLSYGIVHHVDQNKYSIMIPISKNANRYYFRYYDFINKSDTQESLQFKTPYYFNPLKYHSLSPEITYLHKAPSRNPLIFLLIDAD